ncbi:cupin domain-containing protein [Pseudomonas sp. GOM7]|uniref:cupin domain-containing protein n=1 Tax=unclassified Pseudomonas TaxID=196821 RepID=UPI00227B38B7|nr:MULTISPECIES: cupin domain-containing protein [unclassified Pseudomonas]WAJ39298.1 cupin domain-containing protein [Pseudomonas sp. GOM7]
MSHPNALLLALADGRPAADFTHAALGSSDPFDGMRQVAYRSDDGLSVGIVQGAGEHRVEHYPHVEMLVVHAGHLSVQDEQHSLELGVGDSLVIGRGTALRIQASADSLWAFCAYQQASAETRPGLTPLQAYAPLNPSQPPEAQILLSQAPQCRSHNAYADAASNLLIGVWDSTPYARRSRPHKVHELMHLIEGSVTLTLEDGAQLRVNSGDTVFVAQGTPCAWTSTGYVRKLYVVK